MNKLNPLVLIRAFIATMFTGIRLEMANLSLTADMITDKSLQLLHQKLNFCGNVLRDYDSSYAKSGAKIGDSLKIRQPIEHATGTGATMSTTADTKQTQTTLTVNSRRHVPMYFDTEELAMEIDDFTERHIAPAVSKLAAMVESDFAETVLNGVSNIIHAGTKVQFAEILQGRKKLVDNLAEDGDRHAILDTQANVDLVDELKGLFNDTKEVSKMYKEGFMGRTGGFDFSENTILPAHTTGAAGGTSDYLVNDAAAGVADISATDLLSEGTLIIDTGTKTIKAGDTFTLASVYSVHPETKVSTGVLKTFTVLADIAGAGTMQIAPNIVTGGNYKNVSAAPANSSAITFLGAASTAYNQSVVFQKGFAAFATADLKMPKNVSFASRRVFDGISMRLVQDYDIVKDREYTRLDVLYGFKVLRPQLACKILHT